MNLSRDARTGRRSQTTGMRQYNREEYVGNLAVDSTRIPRRREDLRPVPLKRERISRKPRYMNPGYVLFLTVAIALTAMMLVTYLGMQNSVTVSKRQVAAMEKELTHMRATNDETLKRVNASVNLDEIKRIAVEELGMTYATAGQVVVIDDEGNDYVRQFKSMEP